MSQEKELIKKIAEHEVYSTAYKLKLAGILLGKTAKLTGKGISLAAKGIHATVKNMHEKRVAKRKDW